MSQGYSNYWKVLNAKDYGVPQNRERVFVVSVFGEHEPFEFPEKQELTTRLKDLLEPTVDERFYLSSEKVDRFLAQVSYTPTEDIKLHQVGNFEKLANPDKKFNDPQVGRVLDTMGICQALDTMQGGNRQPKVLIKNATKQGYLEATEGDGIDLAYPNSSTRRGRVQKECSPTLQTADTVGTVEIINPLKGKTHYGWHFEQAVYAEDGIVRTVKAGGGSGNIPKVIEPYRIRKLTPLECWRLMGFTDQDFYKAQEVNSNSQLYKQETTISGGSIMDDLVGLVEVWAVDKGLDTADSFKQFAKVAEELGEIAAALARNNEDELRDAIGDTVVTLIILAKQNGMDLEECLQCAYDEIKGRKGKTVNGIFVKEADLGEISG